MALNEWTKYQYCEQCRQIKKVFMLGSKEIDIISNTVIFGTYNDLYLSEKKREEKLFQGIQSANGLKGRTDAKKADGTAITVTTQENVIKKTFSKSFEIPLDFDFFQESCVSLWA